jgi:hypothetical protein
MFSIPTAILIGIITTTIAGVIYHVRENRIAAERAEQEWQDTVRRCQ